MDNTVLVVNPSSCRWSVTPVGTCLTVARRSSHSPTGEPHVSESWSGTCGYGYACARACWPDPISPTVSIYCSRCTVVGSSTRRRCHKAVGLNKDGAGGQASLVRRGCSEYAHSAVCAAYIANGVIKRCFIRVHLFCVQQISLAKDLEGIN